MCGAAAFFVEIRVEACRHHCVWCFVRVVCNCCLQAEWSFVDGYVGALSGVWDDTRLCVVSLGPACLGHVRVVCFWCVGVVCENCIVDASIFILVCVPVLWWVRVVSVF